MNTKKLSLLLCTALFITSLPAFADGVSTIVTPSVVSQYMFRGVRLGGPSFQPSVEVDSGNLAIGVWANKPITDKVPGQSDPEIDPYGSYTFAINDNFSIQPGFTYYTYANAETSNGYYKDTFEPSIAANYSVGNLKLTPKIYYDVVLDGPTYELNIFYAVPLKDQSTEFDFVATVGTFDWADSIKGATPKVKNKGDYFLIGVSVPFQITTTQKLVLGIAYTKGSSNDFTQAGVTTPNAAAVGRGVATISYAITF
ncbi:MAG: hypothetical protein WC378_17190 [Opitutaceae bacterium]|jgi:uncharacterized protein (TIGR02001 family)